MEPLLATAGEMHRRGECASAARICRKILSANAKHAGALHLLGLLRMQQGRPSEALECFSQAVELKPHNPALLVDLAGAGCTLGRVAEAERCCRRALELAPNDAAAHATLGQALLAAGRRDQAHAHLTRALDLDPNLAAAHEYLGELFAQCNRPAEALPLMERAVQLDPSRVTARIQLGRMLLNLNQPAQALPHLTAALAARPSIAELHRNLGNALHGLGRLDEARRAYEEALRLDPQFAWAQANLAMILEHQGQLDDALAWIERAVAGQPGNAMFWAQLANLRERRSEHDAARAAWQHTLSLEPGNARTHLAVGQALRRCGRADEAAEQFHAALRLQPDMIEAHDCLAVLHEELGDRSEAEAAARRALRIKPNHTQARAALARLLGSDLPEDDFQAMTQLVADPQVPAPSRARLLFAQARVLDARGCYPQAAAAASQANALSCELARQGGRAYDAARDMQLADALIETFTPALFERLRGAGNASRRPVFIVGLPRSGSTLVAQVLASHPDVYAAGELSLALETFRAVPSALGIACGTLAGVARLDAEAVDRLAVAHLARLEQIDPSGAACVVDKELANYQFLGLLAVCFPQATFIHCRRDLRDVAVSCWLTDFDHAPWSHAPATIGAYFRRYLRLMRHWGEVLPAAVHEIDYEALVGDFEGHARRLVSCCGLEWHDNCLDFHRTRRQIRTSSAAQVRQPIYARSVARWRNYESHLADLFAALPLDEAC